MTETDLDLRIAYRNSLWSFECRSLELVATAETLAKASTTLLLLARDATAPLDAAEAHLRPASMRQLARLRLLLEVVEPLAE